MPIRAVTPIEGEAADAYALMRTCAPALERALDAETDRERRRAVDAALSHLSVAQRHLHRAAAADGMELRGLISPGRKPRGVASCYGLLRRCAQLLSHAAAKTPNREARSAAEAALASVYLAEDELKKASA